jgi:hypothetical protein
MALADNPREHILHMFRMEAHEGRGHHCRTFQEGERPPGIPLDPGEQVFGIYKGKYYFTDRALIVAENGSILRVPWNAVKRCNTFHGCGETRSRLYLRNGKKVVIQLSDLATGHAGRISQLYHAMIERWGGATGGPLLDPHDFFAVTTGGNSLAPNLYPHPGDRALAERLEEIASRSDVDALKIAADEEEGEVSAQGIVIVSSSAIDAFEDVQRTLAADFLSEADENARKKLGPLATGKNVYEISWD